MNARCACHDLGGEGYDYCSACFALVQAARREDERHDQAASEILEAAPRTA